MTEQELIKAMQAQVSGAQSVLRGIADYGTQQLGTVTFKLGDFEYHLKTVPQQIADFAAQHAADRLSFLRNFGGCPSAQTITRLPTGRINTVKTTFETGYTSEQKLTRAPLTGEIIGLENIIKTPSGEVVFTDKKLFIRENGKFMGVQNA